LGYITKLEKGAHRQSLLRAVSTGVFARFCARESVNLQMDALLCARDLDQGRDSPIVKHYS
jgi:hypothetical protein